MKEFWVAHTNGLLDLRHVSGPFRSVELAKDGAASLAPDGADGAPAKVGTWFAIHQDTPAKNYMTMVDGPYRTRERAEEERQKNIADDQAFEVDCGWQRGFVARVVLPMTGHRAVMVRE